jgi:hypothetical protein
LKVIELFKSASAFFVAKMFFLEEKSSAGLHGGLHQVGALQPVTSQVHKSLTNRFKEVSDL